MKLINDFGVRAFLATMAAIGYYFPLIYVFIKFPLSTETMLALLSAAGAPWLLAMGFYFGNHIAFMTNSKNGNTSPPTDILPK